MGQTDRSRKLTLLAQVDAQTIERSRKHLQALTKDVERVEAAEKSLGKTSDHISDDLGAVSSAVQRNINAVRQRLAVARLDAQASDRIEAALKGEEVARERVTEATERQAAASRRAASAGGGGSAGGGRVRSTSESAGDVSTGLSSIGAVLPGGAGDTFRTLGDLAGVIENLPRLTEGLRGLTGATTGAATAAQAGGVAVGGLGVSLGTLAIVGAPVILAMAALALAIKKFGDDIAAQRARLDVAYNAELRGTELRLSATEEEIQAELERLQVRKQAIEEVNRETEAAREAAKAADGFSGALARLLDKLGLLTSKGEKAATEELDQLNAEIRELGEAAQSEEVQARSAAQATEEVAAAQKQQTVQTQQTTQATREAVGVEQEREAAIRSTTATIQSANNEVRNLVMQMPSRLAQIGTQFEDRFRQLEEQRAEVVESAEQRISDLRQQNQLDEAASLRRLTFDLSRASRELSADIAQIKRDSKFNSFELGLDRNFAGLAAERRQTAFEINEKKIESRLAAQEQKIEAQFERSENLIRLQEQIADARTETERQLLRLEQEYLQVRIQLLQAEAAARAQLMAEIVAARRAQLGTTSGGLTVLGRAGGGPLRAYQSSLVNEGYPGQRERWQTSSGREYMLPGGIGTFTPHSSGHVKPGNGGDIHVAVSIGSYNDRREMARTAGQIVEQRLLEVVR